jgi:hypothetical protein
MPVPNPRRLARRTTRGGHLQCRPEAPLKPTPLLLALLFAALPGAAEPRLEARLVSSPALSRDVRVVVQLPPSYDSSPARRYPVLYFLHDGFGNENVLARRGLATRLDAEMAAGRLPEMLVVSPRGVGTWFTDSHDGKVRYGTFLDASLVPRIDGEFRTLARRSARPPPASRWGATARRAGGCTPRGSSR